MHAEQQDPNKINSPFAHAATSVTIQKPRLPGALVWLAIGGVVVAILIVGGLSLSRYLSDPLRTLEPFVVAKYLDSPQSLSGSRFRAEIRVEALLRFKEGVGRLMLFSTTDDSRPVVVMVPVGVGKDVVFTKGQTYTAELEVKEGGLVYANSCHKN